MRSQAVESGVIAGSRSLSARRSSPGSSFPRSIQRGRDDFTPLWAGPGGRVGAGAAGRGADAEAGGASHPVSTPRPWQIRLGDGGQGGV